MFSELINGTALDNEKADIFFNVKAKDAYNAFTDPEGYSDRSALCTLRYLLGDEYNLCVTVYKRIERTTASLELAKEGIENMKTAFLSGENNFLICSVRVPNSILSWADTEHESLKKYFDMFLEVLGEGWKRVDGVNEFYKSKMEVDLFVNEESKSSVYVVQKATVQKIHYLQTSFTKALPWVFKTKEDITPEIIELLKSLQEKTPDRYIELINKKAETFDMRSKFIEKSLDGFEKRIIEPQISTLVNCVRDLENQINSYRNSIASAISSLQNERVKLIGLQTSMESLDDSQTMGMIEFLKSSSSIDLISCNGAAIDFVVKTYLTEWDENEISFLEHERHNIYSACGTSSGRIPIEDAMLFNKYVFKEKKILIRMKSEFYLDVSFPRDIVSNRSLGRTEYHGYLKNPHHSGYGCLGTWKDQIQEYIQMGDYISAMELCSVSSGQITLDDGTVMSLLSRQLFGGELPNEKFCELPDGRCVTVAEAIEWIKEEEENEQKN